MTWSRIAAPATVVRRLSCLSGFYDYGLREVELLGYSPVANVRRPRVGEDSPTIGLDAAELDRLLTAAEHDSPRSAALVSLLVYNGLRIAEALGSEVTSLTYQRGHRVLRIIRKGGRPSTEPLAPVVLCSATALRCSVFRTPWAMPTLKRPGGTTVPGTTSIDIRPMRWPTTCTAADCRRPHRRKVGVIHQCPTANRGVRSPDQTRYNIKAAVTSCERLVPYLSTRASIAWCCRSVTRIVVCTAGSASFLCWGISNKSSIPPASEGPPAVAR